MNEPLRKELQDVEQKLKSAREAAEATGATERDKWDLKLIEQECLALQQKLRRAEEGEAQGEKQDEPADPRARLEKKLDDALNDTMAGSDPVSVVQPSPVKEHDRKLPEVQAAKDRR
ncbi:MAG: hypothetical protein JOZ58_06970 [Acetobacteraceae bacterium]|nr:hypothetical protein [Acetobacteraceae bacterium]MBV8574767.1 hypothetical protein [Acetobacteraceae bacterium]